VYVNTPDMALMGVARHTDRFQVAAGTVSLGADLNLDALD
jgi:hypothetical protein